MKQDEIIRWAISGIKVKRCALFEAYRLMKDTNPEAARNLLRADRALIDKLQELENIQLEKAKEE